MLFSHDSYANFAALMTSLFRYNLLHQHERTDQVHLDRRQKDMDMKFSVEAYTEYRAKTIAELIDLYNILGPEKKLASWKKAKDGLIEMILELKASQAVVDPATVPGREIEEVFIEEADVLPEIPQKRTSREPKTDEELHRLISGAATIRAAAEQMLSLNDEKNNPIVGYPQMLQVVKMEFPEAKTSIACLRWYAVHLRAEAGVQAVKYRRRAAVHAGDGT